MIESPDSAQNAPAPTRLWARLGPGILFAGAAIGTSHLVQSTRAGALFGLGLFGVIVFANLIKYPGFRIGPQYAAITGESLLAGYARLGRWVVIAIGAVLLLIHAIFIAATAITASGIALAISSSTIDARFFAVGLILLAISLVRGGGFGLLDNINKVCVAALTLCTLVATVIVLPAVQWDLTFEPFHSMDIGVFIFAVALMGFMPAGVDLSIVHSLWTLEKGRKRKLNLQDTLMDFHVGYIGSAGLAVCFLLMGAGVMQTQGVTPASGAADFAAQVISLYTSTLGEWSAVVVGVSALAVMFSTLLAIVDGMPRIQVACLQGAKLVSGKSSSALWIITCVMGGLAILVLLFMMSSFTRFIDFVTITSFILGPFVALLNHVVATRDPVPIEHRLSGGLLWWSRLGIIAMTLVALGYFYFQFLS